MLSSVDMKPSATHRVIAGICPFYTGATFASSKIWIADTDIFFFFITSKNATYFGTFTIKMAIAFQKKKRRRKQSKWFLVHFFPFISLSYIYFQYFFFSFLLFHLLSLLIFSLFFFTLFLLLVYILFRCFFFCFSFFFSSFLHSSFPPFYFSFSSPPSPPLSCALLSPLISGPFFFYFLLFFSFPPPTFIFLLFFILILFLLIPLLS